MVEWELLARDFNIKDTFQIDIQPNYIEKIEFKEVNKDSELVDDEIYITYHCVEKKNN
jgi:hypothetical protein